MPFEIVRNDIVNMRADAIVNPANPNAVIGAGTDAAIHKKAGRKLIRARKRIGVIKTGDAVITPGFKLDAKFIIHTAGPIWQGGTCGEEKRLASCYRESLRLAKQHNCGSIAFPLLSAGTYGFPKSLALQIAIREFSSFLMENEMRIYLVVFDRDAFVLSEKLFSSVAGYIDENYVRAQTWDEYGGDEPCRQNRDSARIQQALDMQEIHQEIEAFPAAGVSASSPSDRQEPVSFPVAAQMPEPLHPAAQASESLHTASRISESLHSGGQESEHLPAAGQTPGHLPHVVRESASFYGDGQEADPLHSPVQTTERMLYAPAIRRPVSLHDDSSDTLSCKAQDLESALGRLDAGFSETLLHLIDRTGKKDSEIYKKANIDRKLFSKIRNNRDYKPSKPTSLAFAIALELDLEETKDFIARAGYALSHSSKFDIIVEYFIQNSNYNIFELNEVLFAFDQPLIGA